MQDNRLLLPLLIQVLLTVSVYIALARAKRRAIAAGEVNLERRALHDDAWPDSVIQINNNIRNQFEVPVLFYVLVLVLWQIGDASALVLGLAWAFVLSRIAHAYVHTGSNYVPLRRRLFTAGVLIVLAMTFVAAWKALT